MPRASSPLIILSAALLAACGPVAQDPATTSGSSSSAASDATPTSTTAGSTDPTTTGSSTTGGATGTTDGATTGSATGTTQGVDTTVDTTGGDTTGADTTGLETMGSDTTTTESSSTGDTGDTADLPDTTGGELCEDGPEQVDVEWSLEVPPELVGEDLTADCEIAGSLVMGSEVAVTFDCLILGVQQEVVLHYSLLPADKFEWVVGYKVELFYRSQPGPWTSEWLKIIGGVTYFRAVRADALVPPDITIEEFYGDKVTMNAPCDPQPDACGQRQGLELRFSFAIEDRQTALVLRSGETGSYGFPVKTRIWLERATKLLQPIGCDDVAPLWLDLVAIDDLSNF